MLTCSTHEHLSVALVTLSLSLPVSFVWHALLIWLCVALVNQVWGIREVSGIG